jgi:hypothetical protein
MDPTEGIGRKPPAEGMEPIEGMVRGAIAGGGVPGDGSGPGEAMAVWEGGPATDGMGLVGGDIGGAGWGLGAGAAWATAGAGIAAGDGGTAGAGAGAGEGGAARGEAAGMEAEDGAAGMPGAVAGRVPTGALPWAAQDAVRASSMPRAMKPWRAASSRGARRTMLMPP